jgi:hypothetical protein
MKYYIKAVSASIVIIIVVIFIRKQWGINLTDFTTSLSVGLILLIPVIFAWAYNMEHKQKRTISRVSQKEQDRIFGTFEHKRIRRELDEFDKASDARNENDNRDRTDDQ